MSSGGPSASTVLDSVVSAPAAINSREKIPGGVFAALPGEHTAGQAFAALKAGAALVIASRRPRG